jgi:hypothetical protein
MPTKVFLLHFSMLFILWTFSFPSSRHPSAHLNFIISFLLSSQRCVLLCRYNLLHSLVYWLTVSKWCFILWCILCRFIGLQNTKFSLLSFIHEEFSDINQDVMYNTNMELGEILFELSWQLELALPVGYQWDIYYIIGYTYLPLTSMCVAWEFTIVEIVVEAKRVAEIGQRMFGTGKGTRTNSCKKVTRTNSCRKSMRE